MPSFTRPNAATPQEAARKTLERMLEGLIGVPDWSPQAASHAAIALAESFKTNFVMCLTSKNPDVTAATVEHLCVTLAQAYAERSNTQPTHRHSALLHAAMTEIAASANPLVTPAVKNLFAQTLQAPQAS